MENAGRPDEAAGLCQPDRRISQAIGCRFAVVDNHRQVELMGKPDLGHEHLTLDVTGRKIIMVIQADLADRHDGCRG